MHVQRTEVDLAYAGTKLSCRFWDIEGAEWSAKGVKTKWPKDLDGCVECKATHLTEFAIVDAKEDWDWGSEKGDWGSKADDWGSKEGDWGSKDDSGPKLAPFQPPPPSPAADFRPARSVDFRHDAATGLLRVDLPVGAAPVDLSVEFPKAGPGA